MHSVAAYDMPALRTISGAIHYVLTRYDQREISERDWEYLCSHLKISLSTIYSIEVSNNGFLFFSRYISFRYCHHAFSEKRVIQFL
jgi:hypothetical protein